MIDKAYREARALKQRANIGRAKHVSHRGTKIMPPRRYALRFVHKSRANFLLLQAMRNGKLRREDLSGGWCCSVDRDVKPICAAFRPQALPFFKPSFLSRRRVSFAPFRADS